MIVLHRVSRFPKFIQPATKVVDIMREVRNSRSKPRLFCDGWNFGQTGRKRKDKKESTHV